MLKLGFTVFLLWLVPLISSAQGFYNTAVLQKIEIQFPFSNWDYRLDTAAMGKDGFIKADLVKVNGNILFNIGVKYKGNSSYDSTRSKNSLHLSLDEYVSTNQYEGFNSIKLNNAYQDPSMIREVLAYNILNNYMNAPRANFAQVYINGTYAGVFTNVEAINKNFCADHFYGKDDIFIKGNPITSASSNSKCNLLKLAGDSTAYFNFYELKSDYGWKQLEALCDTVTNYPNSVERVLDIDKAIWMLAFNNIIVNLDSYSGAFCQNYYLYKDETKRFNFMIWDLNMSFGGFPFLGFSNTSLSSLTIPLMQSMPTSIHSTDNYWPLIKLIQANPTYKKKYIAHMRTILNNQISNGNYLTNYISYKNTIDTAVLSDTKKLFSYSQFTNALTTNYSVGSYSVPGIQTLMSARQSYLSGTSEFTLSAPTIGTLAISNATALNNTILLNITTTNATLVEFHYRYKNKEAFNKIQLFDDGLHNDGNAGDNIYGNNFILKNYSFEYYLYAENTDAGLFSPEAAEHHFHKYNLFPSAIVNNIVINEFLSNNESDVKNEYHVNADWIELYNITNSILDLSNSYLSNTKNKKAKFCFPNGTTIGPYGYLSIWADEMNLPNSTQLHANFKLDKDGDEIILSNGLESTFDYFTFINQAADKSIGRCADGIGGFQELKYPTFGFRNCVVGINEIDSHSGLLSVYPNPAYQQITVKVNGTQEIEMFDLLGNIIFQEVVTEKKVFTINNLPSGVYIIKSKDSYCKIIHIQ